MGWDGPATWRQLETWKVWLKRQWNEPSRTDHYLMQVAAELRRSNVKEPAKVDNNHFKIKFTEKEVRKREGDEESSTISPAQRSAASRAVWGAAIHAKRPK